MKLRNKLPVPALVALQLTLSPLALGVSGMAYAQAIVPFEVRALDRGTDGAAKVFEPAVIRIQPGETVDFVAWDFGHDLIAVDGLLPAGAPGFKGYKNADTSVSFDSEGVYVYQCAAHKAVGMVGLVVVGDPKVNLDAVLASYQGNTTLSEPGIARVGALLDALKSE